MLILLVILILLLFGGVGLATDLLWLLLVGIFVAAIVGYVGRSWNSRYW